MRRPLRDRIFNDEEQIVNIRKRVGKRLKDLGNRLTGREGGKTPEPVENYKKSMAKFLGKSEEEVEGSEPYLKFKERFS